MPFTKSERQMNMIYAKCMDMDVYYYKHHNILCQIDAMWRQRHSRDMTVKLISNIHKYICINVYNWLRLMGVTTKNCFKRWKWKFLIFDDWKTYVSTKHTFLIRTFYYAWKTLEIVYNHKNRHITWLLKGYQDNKL